MKKYSLSMLTVVFIMLVAVTPFALAQEAQEADKAATETTEKALIDINSATLEELMELPGIGEKLGQAIIDGRPYDTIEALLDIAGIGEKKFAAIKDLVEAKPAASSEMKEESAKTTEEPTKKEEKTTEKK